MKFLKKSKVFRDFDKKQFVKKGPIIGIIVASIAIFGIVFVVSQEPEIEYKDEFGGDIEPEQVSEKIQEKLDEIQKMTNSTDYKQTSRGWQTSGPDSPAQSPRYAGCRTT